MRRPRLLVEVARLLDDRLAVLERRTLALLLVPQRTLERPGRVQVLDLDLRAEGVLAGPPGRDVRVAPERALLHPDVRDVERLEGGPELVEVRARLLRGAQVGLGDDLDERDAGAVVVDERVVGLPDPPGRPDVCRLAGVLLHVHARDADPRRRAVDLDLEMAADADGKVVLADLEVLRHVRVEVVLPVEQGVGRDRALPARARSARSTRSPSRSAPGATRGARGRPGTRSCSDPPRTRCDSRRTSSSRSRARRGTPTRRRTRTPRACRRTDYPRRPSLPAAVVRAATGGSVAVAVRNRQSRERQ